MRWTILTALALVCAAPASAEVKAASESGFAISHVKGVKASPERVWAALVTPAHWWSSAHSWSGDATNFSLEARAGGCFCERWAAGEVEHGRVIFAQRGKLLRMRAALGPLQSEALVGTLSVTLTPDGAETKISVDYVVGGYARFALKDVAPGVDGVIGEQMASLAKLVGE